MLLKLNSYSRYIETHFLSFPWKPSRLHIIILHAFCIPAFRMRLRRRISPLKLALLGGALFLLVLVVLQRDVGGGSQEPWFQDLSNRKEQVLELVRGAVNNLAFQIPGQPNTPQMLSDGKMDKNCPSGFYTKDELKPWFERPPEDPQSPGAGGSAFQKDNLTPDEVKEKDEGMTRHCFNQFASDRISLHRSLGDDTRPAE